jgi:hypothetical protein
LWVSQRQLKQFTKIKKQLKKPLQIKLPDLFLLKHVLFKATKKIPLNQNQLYWLMLTDPQLVPPSGKSCSVLK